MYRLKNQEAKTLVKITYVFLLLLLVQSTLWGKCGHMFKKSAYVYVSKTLVPDVTGEGLAAATAQNSQATQRP